ncbi:MAG: hypothetical protein PHR06_05800, partial [Candidatus Cloacimonetes bacterium]|nr:hypothetical protein [Candidatus Cloacimonadota bacterium]
MKKKKWLLYIFIFLVIINAGFYFLVRVAKLDKYVEKRVSALISRELSADVSFGSFSFNERQINITDLQINSFDDFFEVKVKQIYINYDLLKIIFLQLKAQQSIEKISLYEPEIFLDLSVVPTPKNESSRSPDYYSLAKLLKELTVKSGRLAFVYKNKQIDFFEIINDITINLDSQKNIKAELEGFFSKSGRIESKFEINNKNEISAVMSLYDYYNHLQINQVDSLDFKLDVNAEYKNRQFTYQGTFKDMFVKFHGKDFFSEEISLNGDQDYLHLLSDNVFADQSNVVFQFSLK